MMSFPITIVAGTRMKRYVVTALKLTPPSPTYLEVRDAFLAAALATDDKDYARFLAAFAKRGAGAGAVAPERTAKGNLGVVESFSATGTNFEVSARCSWPSGVAGAHVGKHGDSALLTA